MTAAAQWAATAGVLAGVIWVGVGQRQSAQILDDLSDRITALERRSPDEITVNTTEAADLRSVNARLTALELTRTERVAHADDDDDDDTESGDGETAKTPPPRAIAKLKDELKTEVTAAVESEREAAREVRRAERGARWRKRMVSGVEDFAKDRGLDEETTSQVKLLVAKSFDKGHELHEKMRNDEISLYTMQQQMRAFREQTESEARELLDEEDFEALMKMFPRRR